MEKNPAGLAKTGLLVHNEYKELGDDYFSSITKANAMIADLKGIYRNKISKRTYWSL